MSVHAEITSRDCLGVGRSRSSLDVDLSLEGDFANPDEAGHRILQALVDRFAEAGLTVFDQQFSRRPARQNAGEEKWGGYEVEFKLTETVKSSSKKTAWIEFAANRLS
jgi:hypothetical protein